MSRQSRTRPEPSPELFASPLPQATLPQAIAFSSPTACCAVCHGSQIVFDEVFDEGLLLLAECQRCEHRWTSRMRPLARTPLRTSATRPQTNGEVTEYTDPGVASAA